jgi:hypothetical protein
MPQVPSARQVLASVTRQALVERAQAQSASRQAL